MRFFSHSEDDCVGFSFGPSLIEQRNQAYRWHCVLQLTRGVIDMLPVRTAGIVPLIYLSIVACSTFASAEQGDPRRAAVTCQGESKLADFSACWSCEMMSDSAACGRRLRFSKRFAGGIRVLRGAETSFPIRPAAGRLRVPNRWKLRGHRVLCRLWIPRPRATTTCRVRCYQRI